MNATAIAALLIGLLLGIALGAVVGWLLLRGREGALRAELQAARDKASYLDERLDERFRAISAEALAQNNQQFLDLAGSKLAEAGKSATGELEQRKQAIEHLVTPLQDAVTKVERQL